MTHRVFSQDTAWDVYKPRGAGENIKHGLIASAETLLFNTMITAFDYFILKASWSLPTRASIHRTFTAPWLWESRDDFAVNQIGHPLHGLFYFGAGRSNGFSFYQSVFFNALGSFAWEAFGENNHASINDMITMTTGSMATGEMFYRLYLEACAAGFPEPLAFLVNPMAGVTRLLTDWEPPDTGRNLYQLQINLGGGFAETHYSVADFTDEVFSYRGPFAAIGAKVIYGNPFEQETKIPYRHFELFLDYGLNPRKYNHLRILSDGYLLSFSPLHTAVSSMSTGLSMHFDFQTHGKPGMEDGTVDQYSNALDWTVKYQFLSPSDAVLQAKLHAGLTFFGSSKYFAGETVLNDFDHKKTDYNNFGAGLNGKFFTSVENKWARLEMNLLCYVLWTFPGTTRFSHGTVYWLFNDLSYHHFITKHFSLGFTYSYAVEHGSFSDGYLPHRKSNETVKIFAAWNL